MLSRGQEGRPCRGRPNGGTSSGGPRGTSQRILGPPVPASCTWPVNRRFLSRKESQLKASNTPDSSAETLEQSQGPNGSTSSVPTNTLARPQYTECRSPPFPAARAPERRRRQSTREQQSQRHRNH